MPGKTTRPLRNAFEVRKALAHTWNCLQRGEIAPDEARALAYIARSVLAALDQGDLEARIRALEALREP